jgi:hypothetical protein
VNGFGDYQSVIQTAARRGDRTRRVPRDTEQIRALFSEIASRAWASAETDILRRAARSALL